VAIALATAPDVAFIDIGLPDVDSSQLGRRIRAAGNES
jgi:DNA-binding response OmpR family regulator